jgi:hypothetical protein
MHHQRDRDDGCSEGQEGEESKHYVGETDYREQHKQEASHSGHHRKAAARAYTLGGVVAQKSQGRLDDGVKRHRF